MKSSTKSTGKTTIVFEEVIPGKCFTHCFTLKAFCLIPLGTLRHKYELEAQEERAKITQTIRFIPKGLGKIFKRVIISSFRRRLPEIFDDFRFYAEQKTQHPH